MKRVITALMCMISMNCFAQGFEERDYFEGLITKAKVEVEIDVTTTNGLRIVRSGWFTCYKPNEFTSMKTYKFGKSGVRCRLTSFVANNAILYSIEFAYKPNVFGSHKTRVPDDGILLLKTKKDKVLELSNLYSESKQTEVIKTIIEYF